MPKVQHLLETRFSVLPGFTSEWLADRLRVVRMFSLPSVAAQTTDAFTWIVFCDESTDPDILTQLRIEEDRLANLRVILTSERRTRIAIVRELVQPDTDVLITTRLDSDDAIADQYLAAIQDYAEQFHRSSHSHLLLNFPRGYRMDVRRGQLHRGWMPNSPFHSFFERPREALPRGVMSAGHTALFRRYEGNQRLQMPGENGSAWHVRLHQHYPTHQDESMIAWLIAIHGGNQVSGIPPTAPQLPLGSRPVGFTLGEGVLAP